MKPNEVRRRIQECKEKRLTKLNLSNNISMPDEEKLTAIPAEVFNFVWLEKLDLSFNKLSELPDSITRLKNLSQLDLNNNKLSELPDAIRNLQNVSTLNLWNNQLSEIPDSITRLQNLSILDLSFNKLSELPDSITRLQNLSQLDLSRNQLSEIPDSITRLQNLSRLDLSRNQLSEIPDSITRLQNLSSLYLSNNKLSEIPDSITRLQNLSELDSSGNPLVNPPLEIASQGIEAIREYFRYIAEGEETLYEAKLIIVGEGGAGKTTLARKILDPNSPMPKSEETTKGIDVLEWHFQHETGKDFRVNIWDFGGQAIYHDTHRYFLTKRSLYLLVADSRKEHPHFDYWLNIIELLSDNSPLLIIKNELEDRCVAINEAPLRERFANLKNDNLATNLGNPQGGIGLKNIQKAITYHISQLPHIGTPLPKNWIKIRETLENDERNHISLQEYCKICDQNGFKFKQESVTDGRLILSQYLHALGVILHFQEKQTSPLYKTIILKPKWGTDAAYKVLDNKQIRQNRGKFTTADLQNIWQDDEYQSMQAELLELMQEFNLCYPLPNAKNTYIALQLLDIEKPDYDWNNHDNLLLRYEYAFMPRGILSRLIVEMHQYIDEPNVWLSGVILKRDHTLAEVIETYDRREIKIRLSGSNKRGFLEVITDKLDEIHTSFNQLKVKKLIPCNCDVCKDSQTPHFYDLNKLRERLANRKDDIECDKPPYKEVNILSLIDDIGNRNKLLNREQNRQNSDTVDGGNVYLNVRVQNTKGGQPIMEAERLIKTETYNEQTGNFGIGQMSGGEIQAGAKVGGIINESQQKSLAEVAKEIQELLDQLSQTNPTTKNIEKMAVVGKAIDKIEENPSFKSKIIKVLKAVGTESFKEAVDHPLANIFIAGVEAWTE
jgi:signal recognition particle receptor subunit beta